MTAVSSMAPVHEEVHADAERQQRDQDSISGEDVGAVLVGQQQADNGEEGDQDDACARRPKAAGQLWLVS
jgi:hypothetical protein